MDAIRNIDGLPKLHMSSMQREGKPIWDLLDWLSLAFGFQVNDCFPNYVLILYLRWWNVIPSSLTGAHGIMLDKHI
jgi:hypothetical protein